MVPANRARPRWRSKPSPSKPLFSLDYPDVRWAAESDPRGFLRGIDGGAVLAEVQRLPLLLSYLQGIVDDSLTRGRFILTSSHQSEFPRGHAQSLAGRTAFVDLRPLSIRELGGCGPLPSPFGLIHRGCFPRVHEEGLDPRSFYGGYLRTLVERDVRAMIDLPDSKVARFHHFMIRLAETVGRVVHPARLADEVGVSGAAARSWLSVLRASFVVFELPAFVERAGGRPVRSPKTYFSDVGLVAFLLKIQSPCRPGSIPCGAISTKTSSWPTS